MTYLTSEALTDQGTCYVSSAALSAAITPGTPVIMGGTTTDFVESGFTHSSPGRMTYTGMITKNFRVFSAISMSHDSSTATVAHLLIAKNGTVIASSEIDRNVSGTSDIGAAPLMADVSLGTNDYIEVYVDIDNSGKKVKIDRMVLIIEG